MNINEHQQSALPDQVESFRSPLRISKQLPKYQPPKLAALTKLVKRNMLPAISAEPPRAPSSIRRNMAGAQVSPTLSVYQDVPRCSNNHEAMSNPYPIRRQNPSKVGHLHKKQDGADQFYPGLSQLVTHGSLFGAF